MTVHFMKVSGPSATALYDNPSTNPVDYIPYTCPIDTIRFSRLLILDLKDQADLEGKGWKKSEEHTSRTSGFRSFSRSEVIYIREKDGLRVIVEPDGPYISVEVSLPRFCGLENWQLRDVPEGAVEMLLDHIETEILSNTCKVKGKPWGLSRLDLAVDFLADIRQVVRVCRFMRFDGFQTYAVMVSERRLYWPTTRGRFGFYGKTEEVRKKNKSADVPEGLVRFEMQLRDADSMKVLLGAFGRTGRVLVPGGLKGCKGEQQLVTLDYRNLNLVLIERLLSLQPQRVEVPVKPTHWNLGLQAMANDPMLLVAYEAAEPKKSEQTIRKNRKRVDALRTSLQGLDIMELAFGLPHEYWECDEDSAAA